MDGAHDFWSDSPTPTCADAGRAGDEIRGMAM
jgi:hypothetical protein